MLNVSLFWRCCSPWIFTSWPDCRQKALSWSNQISVRGREEKGLFFKGEKMDTPTQCPCTFYTAYSWLSCKAWDHHRATTTVIIRSHTNRLLFVPEAEIHIERLMFWACCEHPRKFTGKAACYSTKSIPVMLPKLEKMLGAVYRSGGNYFEGNKAEYLLSKWNSFTEEFREFSRQPSCFIHAVVRLRQSPALDKYDMMEHLKNGKQQTKPVLGEWLHQHHLVHNYTQTTVGMNPRSAVRSQLLTITPATNTYNVHHTVWQKFFS